MTQLEKEIKQRRVLRDTHVIIYRHKPQVMVEETGSGKSFGQSECAICQFGFQPGQELRRIDCCRHLFHQDCIIAWIQFKIARPFCPLCTEVIQREDCGSQHM